MNPITKQFQFGDQQVSIETNKIAKQATGSVVVTIGNTVVLTTVVGAPTTVVKTTVLPMVTTTDPVACLAILLVSIDTC